MRKALVVFAAVAFAGSAWAQGVKGSGAYGTAGCGLGSMAFGAQPGMIQVLAATTNGCFGTQTFGITSGTSNCGQAAAGVSGTKTFIEGNKEILAKDIARGEGETITTLTTLAGCKDARAVGSTLQQKFPALFPSAQTPAEQVSEAIIQTLRSEKALSCNTLG
jgi:hypothetical protein